MDTRRLLAISMINESMKIRFLACLSGLLLGCASGGCHRGQSAVPSDAVYTGGATWTGEWIRCESWLERVITECSVFAGEKTAGFLIAKGTYLPVSDLWEGGADSQPKFGGLQFSFLGNARFVGPKQVYLLPLDVKQYSAGSIVGFTVATDPCRSFIVSNPVMKLPQILNAMNDESEAKRAFEDYVSDPSVASHAKSFEFSSFSAGSSSAGLWISLVWRDATVTYRGKLIGRCWGSFASERT